MRYGLTFVLLLVGCATPPIPEIANYAGKTSVSLADSEGWYHYVNLHFKGELLNNKPHGYGICRDKQYSGFGPAVSCQFNNGDRVDDAHLRQVAVNQANKASQIREEEREKERRAEVARQQSRENDEYARQTFNGFIQSVNAASQNMASVDRQIENLNIQAQQRKQDEQLARMRADNERRERELNERIARDESREREERRQREYAQNGQQDQAPARNTPNNGIVFVQDKPAANDKTAQEIKELAEAEEEQKARKLALEKAQADGKKMMDANYAKLQEQNVIHMCPEENTSSASSFDESKARAAAERYAKPKSADSRLLSLNTTCKMDQWNNQHLCIAIAKYESPHRGPCPKSKYGVSTGTAK